VGGPARRRDDEGSMLIVALGILTLLSVLALTFVSIMRLEQVASTNYVDGVKARLVAEGGLEASASQLKFRALGESYSDPNADWIYAQGNYWLPIEEATAIRRGDVAAGDTPALNDRRASFAGVLASSYNQGIDQYKVKVLDTQTQFNLNSRFEVIGDVDQAYCRFLDALGVAISKLNPRARSGTSGGRNPILFARYPKDSPNAFRGGEALYRFRQSREGQRFNSKSELLEVLANEDDFNLLQDYVTTRSWFDPNTVTSATNDGLNNRPWGDIQMKEQRSPININLATTEIIAANLAGIAGRFIYLYTGDYDARSARLQDIDAGTAFTSTSFKEETGYGTTGILVYISPFGLQPGPNPLDPPQVSGAIKFAELIKARIKTSGPFRTFAEWEDFVDTTLSDGFLMNTRDDDTNAFVFPGHDRGGNEPLMLQLDEKPLTTPSAADVKRQKDYSGFFYDAVRSMIKANFNPNPRLSGWNPDAVVYLPCDKGSLLYPADLNAPASTKAQRQTNEWCLASKGIFEITSLGEVLGTPPEDLTKGTERIIYSQAKVQGIVQLYETLTHTTQRDFERNGFTYQADTDRFGVSSFPISKLFWDPRAEGLPASEEQRLMEMGGDKPYLHASELDGHLQLATRTQLAAGPDIDDVQDDTQVVELGGRRFELLLQDRHLEAPGTLQASNDDVLIADGSGGVRNSEGMGSRPATGQPKNGFGWPYGDAGQGVAPATRAGKLQEAWKWDTVTPDGYLNSELRKTRLWFRASDANSVAMPATPDGRLRGNSLATGGNVTPTLKGGFELWYKPDFDWTMGSSGLPDQRFCGLLATSHIAKNDGWSAGQTPVQGSWSRGTQMYLTRNTSGDLRITRLYFEVVGPTGHIQEEPRVNDPKAPGTTISFSDYLTRATSDQAYVWPPTELLTIPSPYVDIKFSRTDHWVPYNTLRAWKAHEWHHVAAYWDDKAGEVWLWLDGTPYTTGNGGLVARVWPTSAGRSANSRYIPYVTDPANPTNPPVPASTLGGPAELPSFVRLNAITGPDTPPGGVGQAQYEDSLWPKDQVYIGGVKRDQAVVGGLFKHEKDAILPANGTVDDVRFYDGATPPGNNSSPRRFTATRFDAGSEVGYWTNQFDLSQAFQNGVQEITLAGIQFTAYLPKRYGDTVFANGTGSIKIDFEIQRADGSVVKPATWTDTFSAIRGDPCEIKLLDANVPVRVARGDKLVYRASFTPGLTSTGIGFASPVLDDISLVYYLPNPVVLLKERVIN
jgi:hypothetical protein